MVKPASETNIKKRNAILTAFENMAEGSEMTYGSLSDLVGHSVDIGDAQFSWAKKHAHEKQLAIKHVRGTDRFRRLTKEEIALDVSRARRIKNQAKAGFNEVSVAIRSNDKNVSNIASTKAMRYSMIADVAPTNNRKLVSDRI